MADATVSKTVGPKARVGSTPTFGTSVFFVSTAVLQPVPLPVQTFKTGSKIPVKVCLTDASGTAVTTAVVNVYANSALQGQGRYSDGKYIYDMQTKGFALGNLTITVKLDDGQSYSVLVQMK